MLVFDNWFYLHSFPVIVEIEESCIFLLHNSLQKGLILQEAVFQPGTFKYVGFLLYAVQPINEKYKHLITEIGVSNGFVNATLQQIEFLQQGQVFGCCNFNG